MKVIQQAAILHNGIIYKGKRHKDIVMANHVSKGRIEGFVTNQGLFVDREKAAQLAYMMGQIKNPVDKLKSEHLY
jgi:hypothetical protein